MDVERFKEDVRQGRVTADRLADLLVSALRQLEEAKRRIQELEAQLEQFQAEKREKSEEPYSVAAEEKRQAVRDPKAQVETFQKQGRAKREGGKNCRGRPHRAGLSRGRGSGSVLAVPYASGVAVGRRPGRAGGL